MAGINRGLPISRPSPCGLLADRFMPRFMAGSDSVVTSWKAAEKVSEPFARLMVTILSSMGWRMTTSTRSGS